MHLTALTDAQWQEGLTGHTVKVWPGMGVKVSVETGEGGPEGVGTTEGGPEDKNNTALSWTMALSKVQVLSPHVTITSSRCQVREEL